ncbi:MAG: nucleoside recognition protein [Bacteroidaceae bacterium]|nr:nucleoside recognition protein [Bacteroidaceae bacterium]
MKTIWWIFKITATVSFIMFLLKYTGILTWIATAVSPVFHIFGLPGDAALAYVSAYFINIYSGIAVISTLDMTVRQITILGTMNLAAHAMVAETAIQKKTGTPVIHMVIVRTLASLTLGIVMNLVLPGRPEYTADTIALSEIPFLNIQGELWPMFLVWLKGLARLTVWMTTLILLLNIMQRALYEYGIMNKISRFFSPLLTVFGLPKETTFLWIVANVIGLLYGSAAIMDEMERGKISDRSILLLNTHIGVSHSNLEDLMLFSAIGGVWYWMLLFRWALVTILVWSLRLYFRLTSRP